MKNINQVQSPYRNRSKSRESNASRRYQSNSEGLPASLSVDYSPLMDLIRDQELLNFEFLRSTIGLDDSNEESWLQQVSSQLSVMKPKDQKLIVILSMLTVKGIQIDTSPIGMRILGGKPLLIDHDINFREQSNLLEQIKYLQKVLGIFYKDSGKFKKNSNTRFNQNKDSQQPSLESISSSKLNLYKANSELIRYF